MYYLPILILLLLLITLIAGAISFYRPALASATLLPTGVLLFLLWVPARIAIPDALAVRAGAIGTLPRWSWQMREETWWLGLALIFLLLGAGLLEWFRETPSVSPFSAAILPLLITATALIAAAADSLATLLVGWMLLDIAWLLLLIQPSAPAERRRLPLRFFAFPVITLFLLWLAALTVPEATGTIGLDLHSWPVLTRSLLLLAAVIHIGAFTFHLRPPLALEFPPLAAVLIHVAPAVAGAALLVRVEAAADITLAFALPLTLAALSGFLWAANVAWRHHGERSQMALALSTGQASLLLLAATWAGPSAILAEARVLLLAGGTLLLAAPLKETKLLGKLGSALAIAALAGLPLTAGFTGRAAVYDAWFASGRWLLVLVTAVLHIPFIAAALLLWQEPAGTLRLPQSGRGFALGAGLLLPALGLVGFSGLASASLFAWLAILLPAGAALLLVHFLDETDAARQMVQEALSFPFSLEPLFNAVQETGRTVGLALYEALALLEGERGLVWLLLILLLIWVVGWQL